MKQMKQHTFEPTRHFREEVPMHSQDHGWESLIHHLRAIQPFLYFHNTGNAGDALIYYGMRRLFEEHNIRYQDFTPERFGKIKRIVYGGGGNLVPYFDQCAKFLNWALNEDEVEQVTMLPHTIDGHEDLLSQLDNRFTIYCREETSFAHCKKYFRNGGELHLCDDLAFAAAPLGERVDCVFNFPHVGLERKIRWIRKCRRVRKYVKSGGECFFRTDIEAGDDKIDVRNEDISDTLKSVQKHDLQRLAIAKTFLHFVGQVKTVHTDRLHVAIAAGLFGTRTFLYPGRYHKNQSVFEYSIKRRLPSVAFRESKSEVLRER